MVHFVFFFNGNMSLVFNAFLGKFKAKGRLSFDLRGLYKDYSRIAFVTLIFGPKKDF